MSDEQSPYNPPRADLATGAAAPAQQPIRHSGVGIASFVVAIVAGIAALLIIGFAAYLEMQSPGGLNENDPEAVLVGLLIFAVAFLLIVGAGLGLGGVLQKSRRRLFGVLGLVFNGGILVLLVGLVAFGIAIDG